MLIKGMAVGGTGRQRLRRDFRNWKQIFLREKDWTQKIAIVRSNRRQKCLQVSLLACVHACVTHARSLNLDADPDVPVFFMSDQWTSLHHAQLFFGLNKRADLCIIFCSFSEKRCRDALIAALRQKIAVNKMYFRTLREMVKAWRYYCHLEQCIRRSIFERGLKRRPYVRDRRTTVYFFRVWLAVVEDLVIERENHLAIIILLAKLCVCISLFLYLSYFGFEKWLSQGPWHLFVFACLSQLLKKFSN
jgi:hypothetical protein